MNALTYVGIFLLSYAAYLWTKHCFWKPYEFFLMGWLTAAIFAVSFFEFATRQCLPG